MILFKSFPNKPHVPAKKAVVDPMITITNKASGLYSNIGELLNNKYIPAVTSVAACNNALTGVGLFVSSNFIY